MNLLRRLLRRNRRGAVMVEYAFLLTFIVVPAAVVLLAGGKARFTKYQDTRSIMLSPFP
jgi:Flp pilus assembly pilin Flp